MLGFRSWLLLARKSFIPIKRNSKRREPFAKHSDREIKVASEAVIYVPLIAVQRGILNKTIISSSQPRLWVRDIEGIDIVRALYD